MTEVEAPPVTNELYEGDTQVENNELPIVDGVDDDVTPVVDNENKGDDEDDDDSDEEVNVIINRDGTTSNPVVPVYKSGASKLPGTVVQEKTGVDLDDPGDIRGQPTIDFNLQDLNEEDKPWTKPGADISDYFNYGFVEETWVAYCEKQRIMRGQNPSGPGSRIQPVGTGIQGSGGMNLRMRQNYQPQPRPQQNTLQSAGPPSSISVIGSNTESRRGIQQQQQQNDTSNMTIPTLGSSGPPQQMMYPPAPPFMSGPPPGPQGPFMMGAQPGFAPPPMMYPQGFPGGPPPPGWMNFGGPAPPDMMMTGAPLTMGGPMQPNIIMQDPNADGRATPGSMHSDQGMDDGAMGPNDAGNLVSLTRERTPPPRSRRDRSRDRSPPPPPPRDRTPPRRRRSRSRSQRGASKRSRRRTPERRSRRSRSRSRDRRRH